MKRTQFFFFLKLLRSLTPKPHQTQRQLSLAHPYANLHPPLITLAQSQIHKSRVDSAQHQHTNISTNNVCVSCISEFLKIFTKLIQHPGRMSVTRTFFFISLFVDKCCVNMTIYENFSRAIETGQKSKALSRLSVYSYWGGLCFIALVLSFMF